MLSLNGSGVIMLTNTQTGTTENNITYTLQNDDIFSVPPE